MRNRDFYEGNEPNTLLCEKSKECGVTGEKLGGATAEEKTSRKVHLSWLRVKNLEKSQIEGSVL